MLSNNTIISKANTRLGVRQMQGGFRLGDIPRYILKESRDSLQDDALRMVLGYRRLILNWGTGVGKSRVAVRLADVLAERGKDSILLLVQETAHKGNWAREFREVLGEERAAQLLKVITVECYASLHKYADTVWDCIIADEAHHLRSEGRTSIISTMGTKYFLCLTATLSENGDADLLEKTLEETFGHFESLSFGIQDAIDNEIIGEPKIHVHVLDINRVSRPQQVLIEWGMPWLLKGEPKKVDYKQAVEMIEHRVEPGKTSFKAVCECPAAQAYSLLCRLIEARKKEYDELMQKISDESDASRRAALCKQVTFIENARKLSGARRKNLLGQCKTDFAAWLLRKLEERGTKYVCFCTDVTQVEMLGASNAIHSKKKNNLGVIDSFNEGEINNIFAVEMIKEGQNLKGIQAGVIIQLGGKERDFVQKLGRALRAKNPEQHLIVIDHTRDVDYLGIALENINKKYISVHYWPPKNKS